MAPPPTRTSLLLLLLIHVQVPILAPVRQIDATPSSLFGSNRTPLAHVISRPFRANRFFGCFPRLKPWAESYSPAGQKNILNGLIFVPFLSVPEIFVRQT